MAKSQSALGVIETALASVSSSTVRRYATPVEGARTMREALPLAANAVLVRGVPIQMVLVDGDPLTTSVRAYVTTALANAAMNNKEFASLDDANIALEEVPSKYTLLESVIDDMLSDDLIATGRGKTTREQRALRVPKVVGAPTHKRLPSQDGKLTILEQTVIRIIDELAAFKPIVKAAKKATKANEPQMLSDDDFFADDDGELSEAAE